MLWSKHERTNEKKENETEESEHEAVSPHGLHLPQTHRRFQTDTLFFVKGAFLFFFLSLFCLYSTSICCTESHADSLVHCFVRIV